jgi:tetratricopeptide (TPR) repeat protein
MRAIFLKALAQAAGARGAVALLVLLFAGSAAAQTAPSYESFVDDGNAQLQGGNLDQALSTGDELIRMDNQRWEGYALAGGALMNLKRYKDAVDRLDQAIKLAPSARRASLRSLRARCIAAETAATSPEGAAAVAAEKEKLDQARESFRAAGCPAPDGNIQIPNGAAATKDQMVAADKAVVTYNSAVKAYSDCLQQKLDALVAAGGDKKSLAEEITLLNNDSVDKLQQTAARFNDELRAFKGRSGE